MLCWIPKLGGCEDCSLHSNISLSRAQSLHIGNAAGHETTWNHIKEAAYGASEAAYLSLHRNGESTDRALRSGAFFKK